MTHVIDSPVDDDANTAFGGEKASGHRSFRRCLGGRESTRHHWISVQHQPRDYAI